MHFNILRGLGKDYVDFIIANCRFSSSGAADPFHALPRPLPSLPMKRYATLSIFYLVTACAERAPVGAERDTGKMIDSTAYRFIGREGNELGRT